MPWVEGFDEVVGDFGGVECVWVRGLVFVVPSESEQSYQLDHPVRRLCNTAACSCGTLLC